MFTVTQPINFPIGYRLVSEFSSINKRILTKILISIVVKYGL